MSEQIGNRTKLRSYIKGEGSLEKAERRLSCLRRKIENAFGKVMEKDRKVGRGHVHAEGLFQDAGNQRKLLDLFEGLNAS